MKRGISVMLFTLLFAPIVSAEFTEPEKVELRKIVRGIVDISGAMTSLGLTMNGQDENTHVDVLLTAFNAFDDPIKQCQLALANFANDKGGVSEFEQFATRQEHIDLALSKLATCETNLGTLISRVADVDQVLPVPSVLTTLQNVQASLASFDETLGYQDYAPADFPKMVGPHGWYSAAIRSLVRSNHYLIEAYRDATDVFREADVLTAVPGGPKGSVEEIGGGYDAYGKLFSDQIRVLGMDMDVILPEDEAVIANDTAQGSGIRPFSFFVFPYASEFMGSTGTARYPALPSGRSIEEGMPKHFQQLGRRWGNALKHIANDNADNPAEMRRLFGLGNDTAGEFIADMHDGWGDNDAWFGALNQFFVDIPAPPSGGSGLQCGPGTHDDGNGFCVHDPVVCPPQNPNPFVTIDGVPVQCVDG